MEPRGAWTIDLRAKLLMRVDPNLFLLRLATENMTCAHIKHAALKTFMRIQAGGVKERNPPKYRLLVLIL